MNYKSLCFVCDKQLKDQNSGKDEMQNFGDIDTIPAADGLVFRATGNYGSTIFDPMHHEVWQIIICDNCVYRKRYRISQFRELNGPKLHPMHPPRDFLPGLCNLLFPSLSEGTWGETDLEAQYRMDFPNCDKLSKSPMLDPQVCKKWIDGIHKKRCIDYSYGGFLENRQSLWKGSYLKDFIHLGVDLNVPVGTEVKSLCDCKIIDVLEDKDTNGGWGGRIVTTDNGPGMPAILVYAHMAPLHGLFTKDMRLNRGETIGRVANSDLNGGWYPHLHLQATLGWIPDDGYGHAQGGNLDPFQFFGD